MNNLISYSFIFTIIVTIIVSVLSSAKADYSIYNINPSDIHVSKQGFTWPVPNRYYISSYFGYRNLNVYGASQYHSGIDIPSNEGTYFLAAMPGTITYTGFNGSGRIYYNARK